MISVCTILQTYTARMRKHGQEPQVLQREVGSALLLILSWYQNNLFTNTSPAMKRSLILDDCGEQTQTFTFRIALRPKRLLANIMDLGWGRTCLQFART